LDRVLNSHGVLESIEENGLVFSIAKINQAEKSLCRSDFLYRQKLDRF
jgi:hypothetical protein